MATAALLIQGPLHVNTLRNLEVNATTFDEFVISTWLPRNSQEHEVLQNVEEFLKENTGRLLVASIPDVSRYVYNPANLCLQVASTESGLRSISANVSFKCRSDEHFRLEPFVKAFFSEPEKPLFLNYIVRESDYCDWALSDHLFAGSTTELSSAFTSLSQILLGRQGATWTSIVESAPPPEVLITLSLLSARGENIEFLSGLRARAAVDLLGNHFRLFDLVKLREYEVRANHAALGGIVDFAAFARIWNPRNTIDIRRFRSIGALGPRPAWKRYVRRVIVRLFRNRVTRRLLLRT